jgi:ferredoxin-NADP reductase/DMSO/TMAO reductase YedYZ heme-binding membrane subunit
MLLLVAVMVRRNGPAVRARVDPALWWYVARASGLIAAALLGVAVLGGLLMGSRLARGAARSWTEGLHEFVGALAVVFTAIHLIAVLAVEKLGIGLEQLLVPFTRRANPVAQGCGVLASYLLLAVVVTSWARAVLPWRWWRRLHLLVFPLFGLAFVHAVQAGTDITHPLVSGAGAAVGTLTALLVGARLVGVRRVATRGAAAADGTGAEPRRAPVVVDQAPPTVPPEGSGQGLQLLITQTTWEAHNVLSLRLRHPDLAPLPAWEPGAHIELALPSGRRRQYSLCGDPDDRRSYRIAVLQVPEGRGGSVEVHTGLRPGQLITVYGPRNHFPLVPSPAYLFLAGGIGITAMLAMVRTVASAGAPWRLVYAGRSRAGMAFLDEVRAIDPDCVDVLPTDECGRPALHEFISAAHPGTAVYCCGPDRMLRAVRGYVCARNDLSLHTERFNAAPTEGGHPFQVELRRSGLVVDVPADRSVLQAVRAVLPTVPAGCQQGVCGACRTTVLAGEPDHRDELLSEADRAAGAMLICVSRARGERLTLDL